LLDLILSECQFVLRLRNSCLLCDRTASMAQAAINIAMITMNRTFVRVNILGLPDVCFNLILMRRESLVFFRSCSSAITSSPEPRRRRTQYPLKRGRLSVHSTTKKRT